MSSLIRGLFGWVNNFFWASKNTWGCENLPRTTSWNDLPEDVLIRIALKLEIGDFITMGAVCRSWDAVINLSGDMRRKLQQDCVDSRIPWLLQEHSPSRDLDLIHLYSLSEGKRYSFLKPKFMWESFCCGTSNGWLIMVDGPKFDPLMFLWNPLSAQVIPLPPLSTIPCYIKSLNAGLFERRSVSHFIKRVEVFYVSEHVVVVAAILGLIPFFRGCGQTLVLCTPEQEDAEWTVIEGERDVEWYYDILHHNGMLYVVKRTPYHQVELGAGEEPKRGMFEVCTVSLAHNCEVSLGFIHAKPYCSVDVFEGDHEEKRFWPKDANLNLLIPYGKLLGWLHLAESSNVGELLLITRTSVFFGFYRGEVGARRMWPIHNETRDFKVEVIKFENDKSMYTLTSCASLSNRALFVGSCGAFAYDSEVYKDCTWFLPSELYYYDPLQSKDSGVFCLGDKSIKRCLPSIKAPLPSTLGWFTPKLL